MTDMSILTEAEARTIRQNVIRTAIDYERMNRVFPSQKAALTRAIKTGDPERIAVVTKAAIVVWNEIGAWPDDWRRWQNALDDARPWNAVHIDIADL